MKPFDYLNTSVKSYGRASKVHGIGLFALIDIKKDEQVFPEWKGETGWYKIKWVEAQKLPTEVLSYVLRSFGSEIIDEDSYVNFKLVKNTNFLFSTPLCMLNTLYHNGNVDSTTGIALKDINKDDEIFGNYGNSSQIKLIYKMAKTNYGAEFDWELDVDFPSWANTEIYVKTISKGYLLAGEKPKDAYWRVATTVARRLNKPQLATKFFDYIWKGWLNLATPVLSNTGTDRGLPISCFGIDVADSIYDIGKKNLELMLLANMVVELVLVSIRLDQLVLLLLVMEHQMVLYHSLRFMILLFLLQIKVQ